MNSIVTRIPLLHVSRPRSYNKPPHTIYEVLPSLNHENKGVETLVNAFNTMFDVNQIRISRKEVFGLEVHANHERISYYIVVPDKHKEFLFPKLQQSFKGSGFQEYGRDVSKDNGNSNNTIDSESNRFTSVLDRISNDAKPIDLRLKEHAFMPLNMDKSGEMFHNLLNVLENLKEEEQVFTQVLVQPVDDDWQKDFQHVYEAWKQGETIWSHLGAKEMIQMLLQGFLDAIRNAGKRILKEDVEHESRRHSKGVSAKLKQPGFKTSIRALIDSPYSSRKSQISRAVSTAFRTLAKENDFVSKSIILKQRAKEQMKNRQMPMISINNQILCKDEVKNLWKLPSGEVETEKLMRMTPEEKKIDSEITKDGIYIGHSVHKDHPKDIHFSTKSLDDIARVKLFVASPGAGKSTIIEQLVYESKKQGHGSAIFDVADGSLYRRIIEMLPEYKDDIVCIDYTDEDYRPAFNFNALGGDDATRGMIFAEFFEVLFHTDGLTRAQSYMIKAALTVFSQTDTTLLEFLNVLRDEKFREQFLTRIQKTQPALYLWWKQEVPKISERRWNEIIAPIVTRLDNLLYTNMKYILCQKGGRLTPNKWMDEGKIVVFNMSNGTFTEPEQRILMSLHNHMFWNATLAREKQTKKGITPRPFHLFYDEPQTYMGATPMFDRAISKARKYRVSVNFFIQDAEQVIKEVPDLWRKILGMSPHIMVGPVGETTAKHLSAVMGMSVDEILAIKDHEYYWALKTYANKKAVAPVVFQAVPPRDSKIRKEVTDTSHAKDIQRKWRAHFSTMHKDKLEEDISARSMGMTLEEYRKAIQSFQEEEEESGLIDWSDKNGQHS